MSCSDSITPLLIILISWHTADSFVIFIATSSISKLMCTKYEYHEVTRQPIEILNLIHMYEVMCTKIRINFFYPIQISQIDSLFSFLCILVGHTVNDNSYWKGLYLLKLRFLIAFKLPTRRKTRNTTYKLPTVENFSIRVFKDTVSSHAIIFIHHLFYIWNTIQYIERKYTFKWNFF